MFQYQKALILAFNTSFFTQNNPFFSRHTQENSKDYFEVKNDFKCYFYRFLKYKKVDLTQIWYGEFNLYAFKAKNSL